MCPAEYHSRCSLGPHPCFYDLRGHSGLAGRRVRLLAAWQKVSLQSMFMQAQLQQHGAGISSTKLASGILGVLLLQLDICQSPAIFSMYQFPGLRVLIIHGRTTYRSPSNDSHCTTHAEAIAAPIKRPATAAPAASPLSMSDLLCITCMGMGCMGMGCMCGRMGCNRF